MSVLGVQKMKFNTILISLQSRDMDQHGNCCVTENISKFMPENCLFHILNDKCAGDRLLLLCS